MTFWERLELIEQVNCNYHYKEFKDNFASSFWAWFYLIKVNVALFFGWEGSEEADSSWICGLAYLDIEERTDSGVPMGCFDWTEVCVPCGIANWSFGFESSSNY